MKLKLSPDLSLPLDFATKTAAILAQRRKGKTYTASVIAEEMVAAKQPFVALDPTGAWWGLRASADGKSEGLPVVVLGGQRGDVPLERTGGRLIADLVVDEPGYYVIDFSLFESGDAERQFAVDFAERLYRAKAQPGKDFPLHLFVDEADRFIPQQMRKGSNEMSPRLLGAFEAIVRRGGLRGLGTTLISQRAAVVNKNVLEMLDILITLRTVGPNDREAIAGYIDAHGTDAEREEMMGSLASLDIGEAWVWEPGAEPPLFKRVRIRARHTFNSSATPKAGGEKRVEPKRLADVDLAALHTRMAATIEKAKADDPRELRKQIAELQRSLNTSRPVEKVSTEIRKVEVLTEADRALLKRLTEHIEAFKAAMILGLDPDALRSRFTNTLDDWAKGVVKAQVHFAQIWDAKGVQKVLAKLDGLVYHEAAEKMNNLPAPTRNRILHPASSKPAVSVQLPAEGLTGTQQKILDTIAMLDHRGLARDRARVARWLSIHPNGGRYGSDLAALRAEGYLDGFVLTAKGAQAARAMPTGLAAVYEPLEGTQREIVQALSESAQKFTRETLAAYLGKHPNGGRYGSDLARLRTMGLIPDRGEIYLTEAADR